MGLLAENRTILHIVCVGWDGEGDSLVMQRQRVSGGGVTDALRPRVVKEEKKEEDEEKEKFCVFFTDLGGVEWIECRVGWETALRIISSIVEYHMEGLPGRRGSCGLVSNGRGGQLKCVCSGSEREERGTS